MHNIVCLKWGTKFTPEYVNRLFFGVRRNTTVSFTFHCFTDDPSGLHDDIVIHPLPYKDQVEGWWHKLYLFSKDINISGRVLFLDLDTLVVGNIDHFVTQSTGFVVMRDLWARNQCDVGSAIMSFDVGQHDHIWTSFIQNPNEAIRSLRPHGDQKWIQRHQPSRIYWQDLYPNQIVSFKSQCRSGIPDNTRLICYHGKPSIVESMTVTTNMQGYTIPPTPWVERYWYDD